MKIYLAAVELRTIAVTREIVAARSSMEAAHKALIDFDGTRNVPALAKFKSAGRFQYGLERAQHKWAAQSKDKGAKKTLYTITEMELED